LYLKRLSGHVQHNEDSALNSWCKQRSRATMYSIHHLERHWVTLSFRNTRVLHQTSGL